MMRSTRMIRALPGVSGIYSRYESTFREQVPETPNDVARVVSSSFRAFVVALMLCLFSGAAWGASEITKTVMENGLTVLVKPEPGSGLVAVVAMVKAGAAQESIQNAGIGNFVAHMLLASTRPSSAEEIATVADQVGGNVAARWYPDVTEIRAVTTSALFDRAMSLVGECLTEANFEEKWVEQVRRDLLDRLNGKSDDVFEKAYDELRSLLYEDSGYRRPDTGFERTIRLATPDDLKKYYSTYYVPNNVVIAIAGDVTMEHALDRVGKAFAGIPGGKLPVDRGMPDEKPERSKYRASEVDLDMAYVILGWLAPGTRASDYAAMTVAANALGGGKGSMMFQDLRQMRGLGYNVGTMYPRLKYQSHLIAYVVTDPFRNIIPEMSTALRLEDVKSSMIEKVNQLKAKPLSDKDLRRAKGYTIGSYILSHQHLIDRAFDLAWSEAAGPGYEAYKSYPDALDKVTADDVQRVAGKYLTDYSAVVLLPKTQSPPAGEEGK